MEGSNRAPTTSSRCEGGTRDVGGELSLKIFGCTKPVIAAINGTAVGIGITMILPMDIRIAADTARFGLPFVRRGIVPESCATWFLPRIVGIATSVDWAVTGRIFPASEALAAGLVREILPADQVLVRAHEIAAEIAANTSAVSVALDPTDAVAPTGVTPPHVGQSSGDAGAQALGSSADVAEGVASFKEKRPPRFPSTTRDLPDFYPWWDEEPFDV